MDVAVLVNRDPIARMDHDGRAAVFDDCRAGKGIARKQLVAVIDGRAVYAFEGIVDVAVTFQSVCSVFG